MTDWITKGERVKQVRRYRQFDWPGEPNCGFSFPIDDDGNLTSYDGSSPNPAAVANYEACLTGVVDGQPINDVGITTDEWSYWEPGVLRCRCGAEVVIAMLMTNTCERCGRDYNHSGQLLAPREQWGWDTGETLGEILASDRPLT